MQIRQLQPRDAVVFHTLWLQTLQAHPKAFAAPPENEQHRACQRIARHLADGPANVFAFDTFATDSLMGNWYLLLSP